jgi:DNA relaxase NicK
MAPSYKDGSTTPTFDANVKQLEPLANELNETGKKILEVILTDFSPENEAEAERDVFLKLRNACARAGMLEKKSDQITFFKTLADPQFMQIVKTVGQGLIGIHIVPIVSKVIQQALEGDKTSQKWALEITGILQGKYDFYLNRYQMTHNTLNVGNINFEGKTDAELAELVGSLNDVSEAEILTGTD